MGRLTRLRPTGTDGPGDGQAVTVLEHVTALLAQMDLRHQQRFDAQTMAIGAALNAMKEAVTKAEAATERRFESVNEFRQTLSDQAGTFISRVEFEALREANAERIRELTARLDRTEGRATGFSTGWGFLVGAVGVAAAVIAVAIKLQ